MANKRTENEKEEIENDKGSWIDVAQKQSIIK